MKKSMFVFAVAVIFMCTALNAQDKIAEPEYIAVKFHADWCGSCKAMGPVFQDLQDKLDGDPVLFYRLDFTNNTTKHQSMLMASALGLDQIVQNNPGTGFILLIEADNKKVVEKFTKEDGLKTMAGAISSKY